jgi:hypothetical protein
MMKSEAEHPRLQEFFSGINLNPGFVARLGPMKPSPI